MAYQNISIGTWLIIYKIHKNVVLLSLIKLNSINVIGYIILELFTYGYKDSVPIPLPPARHLMAIIDWCAKKKILKIIFLSQVPQTPPITMLITSFFSYLFKLVNEQKNKEDFKTFYPKPLSQNKKILSTALLQP